MRGKALKHKILKDTWGCIDRLSESHDIEIFQSNLPVIHPMSSTISLMEKHFKQTNQLKVIEQLQDYQMVIVEIKVVKPRK